MITLTEKVRAAIGRTNLKPVWLLEIELVKGSAIERARFSDRPVRLGGVDWKALVSRWGRIDRYFDIDAPDLDIADMTIELSNSPGALDDSPLRLSQRFGKFDRTRSVGRVYLWFDGAGLDEPDGENLNDLTPILTGSIELSSPITPTIFPIDIVADSGPFSSISRASGAITTGRYSRAQWPTIPREIIGKVKPVALGASVPARGIALETSSTVGKVIGPDSLFDPARGATRITIEFPSSAPVSSERPWSAPCSIHVGPWRFDIDRAPTRGRDRTWSYPFGGSGRSARYIPDSFKGADARFAPPAHRRPGADTAGGSTLKRVGMGFQFHHGTADTGAASEPDAPGRFEAQISNLSINGARIDADLVEYDDSRGIAWVKTEALRDRRKTESVESVFLRWSAVAPESSDRTSGLFEPSKLTASYPRGYSRLLARCSIGVFNHSGLRVDKRLALMNDPAAPAIDAQIVSARFEMSYIIRQLTDNSILKLSILGRESSLTVKNIEYIPLRDEGWELKTITSDPLFAGQSILFELSRDVTDLARSVLGRENARENRFEAFITNVENDDDSSWIDIVSCGIKVDYRRISSNSHEEDFDARAIASTKHRHVGEILAALIDPALVGAGWGDASLPVMNFYFTKPLEAPRFAKKLLRSINSSTRFNYSTRKWDLIHPRGNRSPGGAQRRMIDAERALLDESGVSLIERRLQSGADLAREITLIYRQTDGEIGSRFIRLPEERNHSGIALEVETEAILDSDGAEKMARSILLDRSEPRDYYSITLPLGPELDIEPGETILFNSKADGLHEAPMRVVSIDIDPGDILLGQIGSITINARALAATKLGFGLTPFGSTPFGLPATKEI